MKVSRANMDLDLHVMAAVRCWETAEIEETPQLERHSSCLNHRRLSAKGRASKSKRDRMRRRLPPASDQVVHQ
jgi:hypothetical protein